jgi:hypothetical protein
MSAATARTLAAAAAPLIERTVDRSGKLFFGQRNNFVSYRRDKRRAGRLDDTPALDPQPTSSALAHRNATFRSATCNEN